MKKRKLEVLRNRFLATMLTVVLSVPSTGMPLFAATNQQERKPAHYSRELVEELQKLCTGGEQAEDILDELYQEGFIDETGMPIEGGTFDVDGKKMSEEELVKKAKKEKTGNVCLDGNNVTWEEINRLITLKEDLKELHEFMDSDVDINESNQDEYVASIQSLAEQLNNGGVSVYYDPATSTYGAGISHQARVTLSPSATTLTENGKDQTVTVNVKLITKQNEDVTFHYEALSGSASAGGSGTVTIPAGETSAQFEVTYYGTDEKRNGNRVFYISCSEISNALFNSGKFGGRNITIPITVKKQDKFEYLYTKSSGSGYCSSSPYSNEDKYFYVNIGFSAGISYNDIKPILDIPGDKIFETTFSGTPVTVNYSLAGEERGAVAVPCRTNEVYSRFLTGRNPSISKDWYIGLSGSTSYVEHGRLKSSSVTSCSGGRIEIKIKLVHEKVALTRLSIPSGTFYSGQLIPITAVFDEYLDINNTIQLKMTDGKVLTPVELGTVGNSCTFLYQVPEVPSGNIPDITELSIKGTTSYSKDKLLIKGQDPSDTKFDLDKLVNDDPDSFMVGNKECYLRYYKDASFSSIKCSIDDELAGSQWVTEMIDVNQSEGGFYRKWIQTNCEPISKLELDDREDLLSGEEVQEALEETAYSMYADKTNYMISEYVKSMYLSVDGGTTRIPFYVVAKLGNTTETNEVPVALLAYYKPELNIGTQPRTDVAELFLDPDVGSTTDYIREAEKAPLIFSNTAKDIVVPQIYQVKNAVFTYPGAATLDYSNPNPFLSNWAALVENPEDLVSYQLPYDNDNDISHIVTSDLENPEYIVNKYVDDHKEEVKRCISETVNEKELTLREARKNDAITTKVYEIGEPFVTNGFRVEEDELSLTARFDPDTAFSFYGTSNLIWISSDETIANVAYPDEFAGKNAKNYGKDHTAKAIIVPTGKEGKVYFTLYALNGGIDGYTPVEVCKSITLFCQPGKTPFIKFSSPKGQEPRFTGKQNQGLDICFTSNITAQNAQEAESLLNIEDFKLEEYPTEFTLEVFEADASGKATGKAVYKETVSSTIEKTNGKIRIPEKILKKTSQSTVPVYVARISTNKLTGSLGAEGLEQHWNEISAEAGIIVIPEPSKVRLGKLDSYSVLDNSAVKVSYKLECHVTTPVASSLTITDSDGNLVYSEPLKNGSHTISFQPEQVTGMLKQTYVVKASVQDSAGEMPVIDSYVLSVYNHNALDILVNAVDGKTVAGETDQNEITLDNHDKIKSLLSDDGKTIILDGEKISLEELSKDINLQALISINYNDFVWGQISDQIKWEVQEIGKREKKNHDSADTPVTLNYEQGGTYSDIHSYNYVSYAPSEKFLAVGLDKGKTVIKATHARTGMKTQISITSDIVKNQFCMFKFYPAVKTKLEYTNGDGQKCVMETDKHGELALYEESGIASDVHLYSENNGDAYIGTIIRKNLLSGEQDISKMHYYPINNYKLCPITNVHLYIKDEFGNPYANKQIWIRGGVYKNKEYCYAANLGSDRNHLDDGKEDQIFTTDANGKITVYYDASQFYNKKEETLADRALTTEDYILYMLELKFQPNQKVYKEDKVYEPQLIRVSSMLNPYDLVNDCNVTVQARTGKNAPNTAVVNDQLYRQNDNKGYIGDVNNVYDYNGAIGISKHYPTGVLETESIMWGEGVETEPFSYTDTKGNVISYGKVAKKIEEKEYQVFLKDGYGAKIVNQTSKVMYYPFMDMPVVETVWNLKKNEIDKWLEQDEETSLNIEVTHKDTLMKEMPNTFSCVNKSDTDSIEGNKEVKENVQDMLDSVSKGLDWTGSMKGQVNLDSLFAFANNGMSDLISRTGLPLMAKIAPTNDPRCFRLMVTMGDLSMKDDKDSKGEKGSTKNGGCYNANHKDNENTREQYEKLWEDGKDKVARVVDDYERDKDEKQGLSVYKSALGEVQLLYGGAAFLEIRYTDEGKWIVVFCRGGLHAGFDANFVYNKNFAVGPIPCTVGLRAGLYADGGFYGTTTGYYKDINPRTSYLTTAETDLLLDAFAGVGFDCGAAALKMGVFGTVTGYFRYKNVDGWEVDHANRKLNKVQMDGTNATVVGTFGLRLVAKLLFRSYEKTYFSMSHRFIDKDTGDYDNIADWWKNAVYSGDTTGAAKTASLMSVDKCTLESREYLNSSVERAWVGGSNALPSVEGNSSLSKIQSNAYTFAEPISNDDGSLLVYLSDSDSTEVEDTLASYAELEDGSYVNRHGIEPVTYITDQLNNETGEAGEDGLLDPIYDADGKVINKYRKTERTGYGDSTARVAGTKEFSVATWVRQMEPITDMAQKNAADYDVSAMLNQAEVFASVWTGDKWTTCRLTENVNCDFSPAVAVNGKYAIVSWRSCVGTDAKNPLDFNVQDQIQARIYDKQTNTWGDIITLYHGVTGNVLSLESAMMADGTSITAYSVKTGDDANDYDSEIMYTVTKADGTIVENIRVTNDNLVDQNVQVCTVNWNGEEHFILGWYNESVSTETDDAGNALPLRDIRLLAVNAEGTPSNAFVESVRMAGAEVNSSVFRFSKPGKDATLEDLSLVWLDIEKDDTAEISEQKNTFILSAMRFTQNNGKILMSLPTEAARMTAGDTIDTFSCYGNRENLHAVLQSSNYEIDLDDPTTYTVEKVQVADGEEVSKKTEDVYVPVGRTSLYTVATKYTSCGVQTEGAIVEQDKVLPGFMVPVGFEVKNSGIEEIKKLTVTIDGKETEYDIKLLPGQSQTVTAFYEVPEDSILDVNYSITAASEDSVSNPEDCSGMIELNKPEVSLSSAMVVKEEQKTRTIQVALENDSAIPFEKGGKTVNVALYDKNPDLEETKVKPMDSIQIKDNQTLALLDANAYTCQFELSKGEMEQLLATQFTKQQLKESGQEIPEGGIKLYVKTWIEDKEGQVEEKYVDDNQAIVELKSLMDTSQTETTIGSRIEKTETAVNAVVSIKNNSFVNTFKENVTASLVDKDGNIVSAVKQIYDKETQNNGLLTITPEDKKEVTISFTEKDLLDGVKLEDAASVTVSCGEVDDKDLSAQMQSIQIRGQKVTINLFNEVVSKNQKPRTEKKLIEENGEQVEKTVEIRTRKFNGKEVLNKEMLDTLISVMPRNPGDEVKIAIGGKECTGGIGAQTSNIKLQKGSNTVKTTILGSFFKEMDVTRKITDVKKDKQGKVLSQKEKKETTRYQLNKDGKPVDENGEIVDLTAEDIESFEEVYVQNECVYTAVIEPKPVYSGESTIDTPKKPVEKQSVANELLLLKAKMAKTKSDKTQTCQLSWNAIKEADGYVVYGTRIAKDPKTSKTVAMKQLATLKGNKKTSYTHKGLKVNNGYRYQVKAYKLVKGKKKVINESLIVYTFAPDKNSKYGNPTKITVKNTSMNLKAGKTATIEADVVTEGKKKRKKLCTEKRYLTSDSSIATVSKNGKITAKKKGQCYVYVVAQNGVTKKVKVKVS